MNISKLGPQLVLVTLLAMLSPLRCAAMPSVRDERRQPCRTASYSYGYLFVKRGGEYDSLVSVYRNDTVVASARQRNPNSLLQFETDVSRCASQEDKFFINIFNKQARRYVCFNRSGKVKTYRRLPRSNREHHRRLTCRFKEHTVPKQSHLFMYIADERHRSNDKKRVISFCRGDPMAKLRRRRQSQRRAGRRGGRRRHRQQRAVGKSRQQRRQRPAGRHQRHQRRHSRRRCQSVFMKYPL